MTRADQTRHVWRNSRGTYCGVAYDHDRDVIMPHLSTCVACQVAYAAEVYAEQAGKTTPAQFARDTRVTCPLLGARRIAKIIGISHQAVAFALKASAKKGRPRKPRCPTCGHAMVAVRASADPHGSG